MSPGERTAVPDAPEPRAQFFRPYPAWHRSMITAVYILVPCPRDFHDAPAGAVLTKIQT